MPGALRERSSRGADPLPRRATPIFHSPTYSDVLLVRRRAATLDQPRAAARDERGDRFEPTDGGADFVGKGAAAARQGGAFGFGRKGRGDESTVAHQAERRREEDLRDRLVAAEAALEIVLFAARDAGGEESVLVESGGRIEPLE